MLLALDLSVSVFTLAACENPNADPIEGPDGAKKAISDTSSSERNVVEVRAAEFFGGEASPTTAHRGRTVYFAVEDFEPGQNAWIM